jgi:hypothetical protein
VFGIFVISGVSKIGDIGATSEKNSYADEAVAVPSPGSENTKNFPTQMGAQLSSFRMALGALIIKEKLRMISARNSRKNPGKPLSVILYRSINLQ